MKRWKIIEHISFAVGSALFLGSWFYGEYSDSEKRLFDITLGAAESYNNHIQNTNQYAIAANQLKGKEHANLEDSINFGLNIYNSFYSYLDAFEQIERLQNGGYFNDLDTGKVATIRHKLLRFQNDLVVSDMKQDRKGTIRAIDSIVILRRNSMPELYLTEQMVYASSKNRINMLFHNEQSHGFYKLLFYFIGTFLITSSWVIKVVLERNEMKYRSAEENRILQRLDRLNHSMNEIRNRIN